MGVSTASSDFLFCPFDLWACLLSGILKSVLGTSEASKSLPRRQQETHLEDSHDARLQKGVGWDMVLPLCTHLSVEAEPF